MKLSFFFLLLILFFPSQYLVSQGTTPVVIQQEGSSLSIDEAIKKATEHYNLDNYEKSLEVIRQVITTDLQNPKLRYLAAHNHWKLKNYSSAETHFKVFIQVESAQEFGYIELALLFLEQNKLRDAADILSKGRIKIGEVTLSSRYYNVLARVTLAQGMYSRSLAFIELSKEKANEKDVANKFESLLIETRINILLHKYDAAEIPILWALSIKNNNSYALNLAGVLYSNWANVTPNATQKLERMETAKKYFSEAKKVADSGSSLYSIIESNLKRIP